MEEHHNISEARELIADLSMRCIDSMNNREFSNISKLPYKVMAFVNSMNWRMKECAEAAVQLLESNMTHPALMLIRSSMENAAITIGLTDVVRNVVERKEVIDEDDENLMRFLFGNNYPKDEPFFDDNDERFKAKRIGKYVKRADELWTGFQGYYSALCEYVHPNYDGVSQSYSLLNIEKGYTDFGPMITPKHDLYDAFTITLVLALTIYIRQVEYIDDNLEEFAHLCDIDIVKKILK